MAKVGSKREKDLNSAEIDEEKGEQGTRNFKLYVSDIELTNNCMLVNIGSILSVHLGHFSFSTINTKNETYRKKN